MCVDPNESWLALGTSSGFHICWDLRFQLPISTFSHQTSKCYLASQLCCFTLLGVHHARLLDVFLSQMRVLGALHAIQLSHRGLYPQCKGTMKYPCGTWRRSAVRQCCGLALLNHFLPIVKTINRRYCQTYCLPVVYSMSRFFILCVFTVFQSPNSVCAMFAGTVDKSPFLITGGSDRRLRYWDLESHVNSHIVVPAAHDNLNPAHLVYKYASKAKSLFFSYF